MIPDPAPDTLPISLLFNMLCLGAYSLSQLPFCCQIAKNSFSLPNFLHMLSTMNQPNSHMGDIQPSKIPSVAPLVRFYVQVILKSSDISYSLSTSLAILRSYLCFPLTYASIIVVVTRTHLSCTCSHQTLDTATQPTIITRCMLNPPN